MQYYIQKQNNKVGAAEAAGKMSLIKVSLLEGLNITHHLHVKILNTYPVPSHL